MPLPPGLILNPSTGELTGTPTQAGTFEIKLKVRDALGNEREITDPVTIESYTPMSWNGSLGVLMATRAIPNNTIQRTNGLAPYSYVIQSGALPAGLSLDSGTGAITGTPTTDNEVYQFILRATDGLGQTIDLVQEGTVAENLIIDYATPAVGTVGVAVAHGTSINGGTAPYTFAITSGTLPTGLSLNTASGAITGTAVAASSAVIEVTCTDAQGFTAVDSFTFDIRWAPTVSGSFVRSMAGKAGYSRTFTGSDGHTPYAWSASDLPPGLSINASTGEVTGTPTTAGTYLPVITLTDAEGNVDTFSQQVQIAAALTIGGTYTAGATRNVEYQTFQPTVSGGWLPRAFDISVGSLPTGLTLNASTGAISGTPTVQAAYTATLRVTDADGDTATMAVNITVAGDMSVTGDVPARGTTTVAFSGDTLGVTGGTSPYVWSLSAGALPPGLTLNTGTGDISGTPTTAGTYNYTVRVTDATGGYATRAETTVIAAYPTLTGNLPDDTVNTTYSFSLARAGGHSPYAFDLSAGTLPTGLTINASTGVVSGTSTVEGSYDFTVRVTDDAGNIATSAQNITIYSAPAFGGGSYADGEVTDPYSAGGPTATGGKAPLSWTKIGGTIPPGLTLNASTGAITGTPTTAGTYSFTVKVTDALGAGPSLDVSVQIVAKVNIAINHESRAEDNIAYSSQAAVQLGTGKTPLTWAVVSGAVPTGLSLAAATGILSGTPTTPGTYTYSLRVTDAYGVTDTQSMSITVYATPSLTGSAGDGIVGKAYSFTPSRTGGLGPYTYSLASGTAPSGCSLNASTGAITGTPTVAATFSPTIRVTDLLGGTDTLALSITIAAPLTLTLSYPRGTVSETYSGTITTGGGHTPKTYARVAGTLPPGLTLNSTTGALTGTPTTAGTYSFTIRVTDAMGNTKDAAGSIAIAAALNIAGVFANGQVGQAYSSTVTASGGWGTKTFSLVSGTIPAGTTRSGGTISGTPTTATTYNFTLRITDADGDTFDKAFSVVIASNPYNVTASPNPTSDSAFSGSTTVSVQASSTATVVGASGTATYTWTRVGVSGDIGDFTITFANGNRTITATRSGRLEYHRTETWRCTANTSTGQSDTVDVPITLTIFSNI